MNIRGHCIILEEESSMPITEKATIRIKCTFSKDRKHKFLLTLEWEEKKPKAVVIMTSPAEANCIETDLTTSLVIKNLHALGYGGCDLVNLGSTLHYKNLLWIKRKRITTRKIRRSFRGVLQMKRMKKQSLHGFMW